MTTIGLVRFRLVSLRFKVPVNNFAVGTEPLFPGYLRVLWGA